jgi:hypothetical protein
MADEPSRLTKRLWIRLGALALIGSAVSQCIFHPDAFHNQGFKTFPWAGVLVPAFAVIMAFWLLLVGQRKKVTTLDIDESATKKLE